MHDLIFDSKLLLGNNLFWNWKVDQVLMKMHLPSPFVFILGSSFNASIVLDSSVIKSYTIPIQASLAWPNLVEQSIKFPATHVGNVSIEEMIITNPSDHPLVVQVVPLLSYPQPDGGLDLLSDR